MKASSLALLASIAINLALGYYWFNRAANAESAPAGARSGVEANDTAQPDTAPQTTAVASQSSPVEGNDPWQLPPGRWEILMVADNVEVLADRLRETGMPLPLLREVLQRHLLIQYGPASVAILGPVNPFWQPSGLEDARLHNPDHLIEYRQLTEEMDQKLRAALGDDYYLSSTDMIASYRSQYGDLSDERIVGIAHIQEEFSQRLSELLMFTVPVSAEDRAKLGQIEEDRLAAIEAYLTPSEFEEYRLRNSSSANRLKNTLAAFNPTEDEFRALAELEIEFDSQYPLGIGTTIEQSRERATHLPELRLQQQAVLPADRVEAFQLSQEPGATQVSRLVSRLDLPTETTWLLLRTQKEIQDRAQAIQSDSTLDPANKSAQLGALAVEAGNRITSTLGETGFELYRQYAGTWLNILNAGSGRGGAIPPGLVLPF